MTYNRMEAKPIAGAHCRFCGDANAPLGKTPCGQQWMCWATAFVSLRGGGGATWSTNASACAMPTMRSSMAARGNAVSSAVSSGRPAMTTRLRKPRSMGQNMERW